MSLVRYEHRSPAAVLTLARADKRNALSRALIADLNAAVRRAADDKDVRCVIFTGDGPAFCAGMDLDELRSTLTADAETIWSDQPRRGCMRFQKVVRLQHVVHRDAFSDADDKRQAGIRCFHDRISRERRRHINHRGIRSRFTNRIRDRVENRNPLVHAAALARRHTAYDVRSIFNHLFCMKRALFARNALHDEACIFINQNAQ